MSDPAAFLAKLTGALNRAGIPHIRKARPFSRSELERRAMFTVLGVQVFVASAEDTVLAKLEWAKLRESERQLRDVRGIIDVKGGTLDHVYIETWLGELGVRDLWERARRR